MMIIIIITNNNNKYVCVNKKGCMYIKINKRFNPDVTK